VSDLVQPECDLWWLTDFLRMRGLNGVSWSQKPSVPLPATSSAVVAM
jgi:hypothetical protein